MDKETKEFTVDFPWGKVALVSWGDDRKPPILMVHGYMDSASTFLPLMEHLPDKYYYVGLDMPGHGKSDQFPPGLLVSQIHMVEVIRGVVKYMKWKSFIYISHSMGFIIGVLYNHIFPGKITKMVHIDPALPMSGYYFAHHLIKYWYMHICESYYNNYNKFNGRNPKRITHDEAVNLLVRNRSIPEEKAELVVSRILVPVGDEKYQLSWDQRMKRISSVALSEETLYTIITQYAPPILIIEASENITGQPGRQFSENILKKCKLMVPNFHTVTIEGAHDVHITNPEDVASQTVKFLKNRNNNYVSKLISKL